jgi:ABC-type transport system involved in multi-copper enzyme maturation permease subunit
MRMPIRYLPWMLRDMLFSQRLVPLIVSTFAYVITIQFDPVPPADRGPFLVGNLVTQVGWIFVLLCTAGMVSTDRNQGFYRSYFSRPVSPPLFNLQRWLVGAVLIAAIVPLVSAGFALAVGRFPIDWRVVGRLELFYLLLGGVIFLCSTLMRIDWLVGFMVLMLQSMLNSFHASPNFKLPAFWESFYRLLPPFHLTNVTAPSLTTSQLIHVLLYGTGLVLAALAVLRWRPLGVGGRA